MNLKRLSSRAYSAFAHGEFGVGPGADEQRESGVGMSDEKKKSLSNEDISTTTVSRRGTFGILGAGALAASVAAVGMASNTAKAIPNCTDRDPQDPAGNGRGRGISDSDPRDPAGCGSRACSDSDPNDPAGRGRHC
jgi:hypothetical protein